MIKFLPAALEVGVVLFVVFSSGKPQNYSSWINVCPVASCNCFNTSGCASYPSAVLPLRCELNNSDVVLVLQGTSQCNIVTLDLSYREITTVPRITIGKNTHLENLSLSFNRIQDLEPGAFVGLTNLKYLYLDHNLVSVIRNGIFNGLDNLQYLSLAHNRLTRWDGSLFTDLPYLVHVDLTGNTNYTLKTKPNFLLNSSLMLISGVTMSKRCTKCNLRRKPVALELRLPKNNSCNYVPNETLSTIKRLQSNYVVFRGKCANRTCQLSLVSLRKVRNALKIKNRCWAKGRNLRTVEYCFGTLAVALNFVVIVTTLAAKSLLRRPAFLLTTHLALCDLLVGVYAISVAMGHGIEKDPAIRFWRENSCPYFRSLFVAGQTAGVLTSLLVTMERYLAIIYCMVPSRRVSLKTACRAIFFIWVLVISSCVILQFVDKALIRDNWMCVLVQNFARAKTVLFSEILMLFAVLVYFLVVGMYLRIFLFVRKSSRVARVSRVRRETNMARNLGHARAVDEARLSKSESRNASRLRDFTKKTDLKSRLPPFSSP